MDLALNNLQRLISYKTQTTNQPSAEMQSVYSTAPANWLGASLTVFTILT